MPLPYETVEQIRERILAIKALEYDDGDGTHVLDTSEGSIPWIEAQAEALLVHDLQVQVNDKAEQILPDRAEGTLLDRHAALWLGPDNARLPALDANTEVLCSDGTSYKTIAATSVPALSSLSIACRSITLGAVANKAIGTVGMLASPPTGFAAQATLAATTTPGEDAETDTELQLRNAERLREMPGGGNCAQYRVVARATDGSVAEVFVYPMWAGKGTTYVVPLGETAANSDDGETHRILAGTVIDAIQEDLDTEVTPDAVGAESLVLAPTPQLVNVDLNVEPETGSEPDWTTPASYTVAAPGGYPIGRVRLTAPPAATLAGKRVVLFIGGSLTPGQYTVQAPVGSDYIDVTPTPSDHADTGSSVLPGGPLWETIYASILNAFDACGPSGSTAPDVTDRDPAPEASRHPEMNVSAISAAAKTTTGVRDVAVTLPAADVTNNVAPGATPKLLMLGTFICRWV
jgi:uncharacterized phage protein gp47/JayE